MKKLCSLFLSILMIVSGICVAEATTSLNAALTFDEMTTGAITPAQLSGAIFRAPEGKSTALEITEDGYKGKALKITSAADNQVVQTQSFEATEDEPVYISFKLQILNKGTSTTTFPIDFGWDSLVNIQPNGGRDVLWTIGSNQKIPYELGKWYDFRIKFTPGRADVQIEDENGNIAAGYRVAANKYLRFKAQNGVCVAMDEVQVIKGDGSDSLSFVSSDYGATPFNKTVVAHEKFDDPSITNLRNYMITNNPNFVSSGFYEPEYLAHTMESDCNGGYCPEITIVDGRAPFFNTATASYDTGKAFVSTKIKIVNDTDANGTKYNLGNFGFGVANSSDPTSDDLMIRNGVFETWHYWGRQTYTYTPDVWYTIVFEFEKVSGVNQASVHIYDDRGNKVLYSAPVPNQSPKGALTDSARMSYRAMKEPATYQIDDIMVLQTDAEDSNAFIACEILGEKSGADIFTTTPVIKASFDQVVAAGSTAKFTATGKEDIAATVKYTGSPLVEISPVSPLDYDTEYRLNLAGVKGINGQGLATSSLTNLSLKTPVYTVGGLTVGTPSFTGTDMEVDVTFANEEYKELNAYVIAALYTGNKLEWVEIQKVTGAELGENTFTFKNVPEGAESMELRVFAWDNFTQLRPLYR